jgi:hypothetical protein
MIVEAVDLFANALQAFVDIPFFRLLLHFNPRASFQEFRRRIART